MALPNSCTPEFVRIPRRREVCPVTSLSGQKILNLIQEKKIKSVRLPPGGKTRGVVLVHMPSLLEFLRSKMEEAR